MDEHSSDLLLDELQSRFSGKILQRPSGRELVFVCPFCQSPRTNPSFHFNVDKGIGHCWRENHCGWKGNYFKFFNDYEGFDESEVCEMLDISEPDEIDLLIKEFDKLLNTKKTIIREELDYHHLVGAIEIVPTNIHLYPDVIEWLEDREYDPIEFCKVHNMYYPPQIGDYKNRVMFKICNDKDKTYLNYSMDRKNFIKTINAKDSDFSKYLYNYENAKDSDVVFIVEGLFDTARVLTFDLGINHSSVSLLGVNLTTQKLVRLQKLKAKEVVICLDNGVEEKAWKMFLNLGKMIPKQVSLMNITQKGADPDSLTEKEFKFYYEKRRIYERY